MFNRRGRVFFHGRILKIRNYENNLKSKVMKIKTTVNVQKEIDVEIKTPYFCKSANGYVFYKVLNEDGHNICVSTYRFQTGIEFSEILNEYLIFTKDNTEIEESEFNEAFERTMEILKNK